MRGKTTFIFCQGLLLIKYFYSHDYRFCDVGNICPNSWPNKVNCWAENLIAQTYNVRKCNSCWCIVYTQLSAPSKQQPEGKARTATITATNQYSNTHSLYVMSVLQHQRKFEVICTKQGFMRGGRGGGGTLWFLTPAPLDTQPYIWYNIYILTCIHTCTHTYICTYIHIHA